MILDIDIRVSSENGVQIHQFTKHFDSRFEGRKIESGNVIDKSFEDFLAEFLSGSGKVIRNQLISKESKEITNHFNQQSTDLHNIEYTLKLGDSQFVSGKIPLDKLIHLSEMSRLSSTPKEDLSFVSSSDFYDTQTNTNTSPDTTLMSSNDSLALKRTIFKPAINLEEVDQMFQQIITTAVTKYENNFFIHEQDNTGFIKSS
ncbi:hypothetical protein [Candidatus Galacturonibacter soehngenii]|uniref:Uncharacterized protein n=1 Tax=Candidatus Galacturonatibacter soehngenii TaxID=2307010 RepID=A0A7V7UDI7_9FIRM|nr:hypothetical protein [Candidatus Galacturonibacter soehngenii]KAB1440581.1 hypothetical protein F7O84_01760 [Candidatus Galacturonibacter soehngenii]MBA4687839.1 hypothetical protein [Candidatus Galacturonibacter soehngenii]